MFKGSLFQKIENGRMNGEILCVIIVCYLYDIWTWRIIELKKRFSKVLEFCRRNNKNELRIKKVNWQDCELLWFEVRYSSIADQTLFTLERSWWIRSWWCDSLLCFTFECNFYLNLVKLIKTSDKIRWYYCLYKLIVHRQCNSSLSEDH